MIMSLKDMGKEANRIPRGDGRGVEWGGDGGSQGQSALECRMSGRMVRKGLSEEALFKRRPKGGAARQPWEELGESILDRENSRAEALRQEGGQRGWNIGTRGDGGRVNWTRPCWAFWVMMRVGHQGQKNGRLGFCFKPPMCCSQKNGLGERCEVGEAKRREICEVASAVVTRPRRQGDETALVRRTGGTAVGSLLSGGNNLCKQEEWTDILGNVKQCFVAWRWS